VITPPERILHNSTQLASSVTTANRALLRGAEKAGQEIARHVSHFSIFIPAFWIVLHFHIPHFSRAAVVTELPIDELSDGESGRANMSLVIKDVNTRITIVTDIEQVLVYLNISLIFRPINKRIRTMTSFSVVTGACDRIH